jgi:hypothetical protein
VQYRCANWRVRGDDMNGSHRLLGFVFRKPRSARWQRLQILQQFVLSKNSANSAMAKALLQYVR